MRDFKFSDPMIRRLQVAAEDGQSTLFLYRTGRRQVSQWAALRLELLPATEGKKSSSRDAARDEKRRESGRLQGSRRKSDAGRRSRVDTPVNEHFEPLFSEVMRPSGTFLQVSVLKAVGTHRRPQVQIFL